MPAITPYSVIPWPTWLRNQSPILALRMVDETLLINVYWLHPSRWSSQLRPQASEDGKWGPRTFANFAAKVRRSLALNRHRRDLRP